MNLVPKHGHTTSFTQPTIANQSVSNTTVFGTYFGAKWTNLTPINMVNSIRVYSAMRTHQGQGSNTLRVGRGEIRESSQLFTGSLKKSPPWIISCILRKNNPVEKCRDLIAN